MLLPEFVVPLLHLLPLFFLFSLLSPAVKASARFVEQTPEFTQGIWPDQSQDLCFVAEETLKYLNKGQSYDPAAIHGGKIPGASFDITRVKATLQFLCNVSQQDKAAGRKSRLTDPAFMQKEFEFVRWHPDTSAAAKVAKDKPLLLKLPADKLLLTKYYVRIADGQAQKSTSHPQALYGLPYDEAHLNLADADKLGKKITRFQLGKQNIVLGALEQKPLKAPALAWVSREDLEGALLQGTAVIPQENGSYRYLNVHRSNGIPYNRLLKPEQQQRYWYFKDVKSVLGYGKDADYKIPIAPQVTVAGDIVNLGLGKLILLATPESGKVHYRLTVLADTGGAFANNQFQLDWLSGYYRDWAHYHQANKHRGDYSQVWLLLKKQ